MLKYSLQNPWGRVSQLVGDMQRSSWRLGSRGPSTPSPSSSPSHLLQTCTNRPLGVDQRCLNTLSKTLGDEFHNLLGSCGGALGGWGAEDLAHQALLLPHCVCFRPTHTVHLESTKGDYGIPEEEQVEDGNMSE
ncbi:hypothetical protein Taro_006904 [Colocasia esculenta]|uniref:Uncharacterized protein n=1 Tax=Colocasia esculenta TaxID=4460 RepID=A0A843TYB4_COLES|nr:hypothetical protein [Colocasia esculenta]